MFSFFDFCVQRYKKMREKPNFILPFTFGHQDRKTERQKDNKTSRQQDIKTTRQQDNKSSR